MPTHAPVTPGTTGVVVRTDQPSYDRGVVGEATVRFTITNPGFQVVQYAVSPSIRVR